MKDAVHRVATSCYKNLNLLTRKKVRYSKSAERFISETQQNDSGYRKIRNIVERYIKVELGETTEPIISGEKRINISGNAKERFIEVQKQTRDLVTLQDLLLLSSNKYFMLGLILLQLTPR